MRLNFGLHEEEQAQNEKRLKFIVSISQNKDRNDDRKRYNVPTVNDIAMISQNPVGDHPFHRDFRVYSQDRIDFIRAEFLRQYCERYLRQFAYC